MIWGVLPLFLVQHPNHLETPIIKIATMISIALALGGRFAKNSCPPLQFRKWWPWWPPKFTISPWNHQPKKKCCVNVFGCQVSHALIKALKMTKLGSSETFRWLSNILKNSKAFSHSPTFSNALMTAPKHTKSWLSWFLESWFRNQRGHPLKLTYCWWFRNPGNQLNTVNIPLFTGFYTSQVVFSPDFFH